MTTMLTARARCLTRMLPASDDGKTSVTNYSPSVPGYGENNIFRDVPPGYMELSLAPCQAVLIKIALK